MKNVWNLPECVSGRSRPQNSQNSRNLIKVFWHFLPWSMGTKIVWNCSECFPQLSGILYCVNWLWIYLLPSICEQRIGNSIVWVL